MALTQHQEQALDDYFDLIALHPELIADRSSRPIITERAALERYAAEKNVVLGISTNNPYVLFVNDLVESTMADGSKKIHPYLRILPRAQLSGGAGVVVVGTIENPELGPYGAMVLVELERHALGTLEVELPRGFAEAGRSLAEQALREIAEESGLTGDRATYLGRTVTDSGLMNGVVSFYHVPLTHRAPGVGEGGEAIEGVHLVPSEGIWQRIDSGAIRDGFTLQALALYERHLERLRRARAGFPDRFGL